MKTIQKNTSSIFRKILFAALAVITLSTTSCRKDDDAPAPPLPPSVDLLSGFMNAAGLVNNEPITDNYYFELGLEFSTNSNGQMKNVKVNIPDNQNVRVTLWDSDTHAVLSSTTVTTVSGQWATKDFGNYALVKDKKYVLTFNTKTYNYRRKNNGSAITYPLAYNSFTIHSFKYGYGSSQAFPTLSDNNYAGDLSFDFQPN